MPLTLIFISAMVAIFSSNPKRKKRWAVICFLVIFIGGNGFLVNEAMRAWELHPPEPQGSYDVAVVLTGGIALNREGESYAQISADRMVQALLLYKKGTVKKILVSGGEVSIAALKKDQYKEAEATIDLLKKLGVSAQDIIWENQSRNTHENALFSAKILKSQFPNQKYLLCTSAFHLRRALGCFRKQGIELTPVYADTRAAPREIGIERLLFPKEENLFYTYTLIREWIGYTVYAFMGYL